MVNKIENNDSILKMVKRLFEIFFLFDYFSILRFN